MVKQTEIIHLVLLRMLGKSGSPHLTEKIRLLQNYALVFHLFELRTELSNFEMWVT